MRVDEHTIEVAGCPVFYRSAPGPGSPVLYLHGVPTSCDDWTDVLAETGGLAPDLLGFGRSGKAGHLDYSIDGQADFLELLLSELGIDRVRLVAHDWGAAAGLAFAERAPERLERLVLCDALPLLDGFRWPRLARMWRTPVVGEIVMGCVTRRLLARALRHASAATDVWSEARLAAAWRHFDQGTQRAILLMHRGADEARLAAAGATLEALDAPALVIWGDLDPWMPATFADAYAERLPNATVVHVPGAGHWPWLEQAEVAEQIVAFMSERQ